MEVTIREATPRDVPGVLALAKSVGRYICGDEVRFWLAADPGCLLVAVATGDIAGTCCAVRHSPDLGFIGLYIVRQDLRGSGIGSRLWRASRRRLGDRNAGLCGDAVNFRKYQSTQGIEHLDYTILYYENPGTLPPLPILRTDTNADPDLTMVTLYQGSLVSVHKPGSLLSSNPETNVSVGAGSESTPSDEATQKAPGQYVGTRSNAPSAKESRHKEPDTYVGTGSSTTSANETTQKASDSYADTGSNAPSAEESTHKEPDTYTGTGCNAQSADETTHKHLLTEKEKETNLDALWSRGAEELTGRGSVEVQSERRTLPSGDMNATTDDPFGVNQCQHIHPSSNSLQNDETNRCIHPESSGAIFLNETVQGPVLNKEQCTTCASSSIANAGLTLTSSPKVQGRDITTEVDELLRMVASYDQSIRDQSWDRSSLARQSLSWTSCKSAVGLRSGRVVGYGSFREVISGNWVVSPLYADDAQAAEAVLLHLLAGDNFARTPGAVQVRVPEANAPCRHMLEKLGFRRRDLKIMTGYTKWCPSRDMSKVYSTRSTVFCSE